MSWLDGFFNKGPKGDPGPTGPGALTPAISNITSSSGLLAGFLTGFDTTNGAIAISAPVTSVNGASFGAFDAGRAVESNQGMNQSTLTDPTTPTPLMFQNPIDLDLYSTITWGPGSGGGPNPSLPKGYMCAWVRVSGVLGPYWQVIAHS